MGVNRNQEIALMGNNFCQRIGVIIRKAPFGKAGQRMFQAKLAEQEGLNSVYVVIVQKHNCREWGKSGPRGGREFNIFALISAE
jgi:hypothetical protein